MKILILGAGQVGSTIAESLCTEHDVTIVDNNPIAIGKLQAKFDVQAICGQAILPSVLREAGLENADMLIAVTNSDESNILACQMAWLLFKTPIKIARISHAELQVFLQSLVQESLPIDLIIDPAELVTNEMIEQIKHPLFSYIWTFFPDRFLRVAAIAVTPLSPLIHSTLTEIQQKLAMAVPQATFAGVRRNQKILFPPEIIQLEPYDELLLCCPEAHLNKVEQVLLGKANTSHQQIMIAGAGRIGRALALDLEKECAVKLIEVSNKYSQEAANTVDNTLVLLGDATDVDLLKQEDIANVDLFCSVTNEDDVNIMSAILAKRLGAKYTIALVNQQTYAHYLSERSPDIDITISPQYITGSKILRVLYKNIFANIYPIFYGIGYLLEVVVSKTHALFHNVIGNKIAALKLPKNTFLIAIYRTESVIIDFSDLPLQEQDHLLLISRDKKDLNVFLRSEGQL